jgi:hypothetical protein
MPDRASNSPYVDAKLLSRARCRIQRTRGSTMSTSPATGKDCSCRLFLPHSTTRSTSIYCFDVVRARTCSCRCATHVRRSGETLRRCIARSRVSGTLVQFCRPVQPNCCRTFPHRRCCLHTTSLRKDARVCAAWMPSLGASPIGHVLRHLESAVLRRLRRISRPHIPVHRRGRVL